MMSDGKGYKLVGKRWKLHYGRKSMTPEERSVSSRTPRCFEKINFSSVLVSSKRSNRPSADHWPVINLQKCMKFGSMSCRSAAQIFHLSHSLLFSEVLHTLPESNPEAVELSVNLFQIKKFRVKIVDAKIFFQPFSPLCILRA